MSSLNLDDTINKYLDIINDNILEPYLIENVYAKPTKEAKVGMVDDNANVWFFTSSGDTVTLNTGANGLIPKYDAVDDATAILKIPQDGTHKDAVIINAVRTVTIASGTKINNAKLSTDIDSDENGFIYYTTGNDKLYNLEQFKNINYQTEDTTIVDNDYYDFFVRYKTLKYIKDTHLSAKNSELRTTVIAKLKENETIVEKGITSRIDTLKIGKMLDLLHFINNNKFDKFEPLVNCLYYYYWMALVDYNQNYCSTQLTYFEYNSFRRGGDAHTAIGKLNGASGFGTGFDASPAKRLIENVLIDIFERFYKTTSKYTKIIENINSDDCINIKTLIQCLLNLYGNDSTENRNLNFAEYNSSIHNISLVICDTPLKVMQQVIISDIKTFKNADTSATIDDIIIVNNAITVDTSGLTDSTYADDVAAKAAADSAISSFTTTVTLSAPTVKALYYAKYLWSIGSTTDDRVTTGLTSIDLHSSTKAAIIAMYKPSSTSENVRTAARNANYTSLSDSVALTNQATLDIENGENTDHYLYLDKSNNTNQTYNPSNSFDSGSFTYNSILSRLLQDSTLANIANHITKIRELHSKLSTATAFTTALAEDSNKIYKFSGDFDTADFTPGLIDTQLTNIKTELKKILDDYDKAVKLDKIETKLHKIPNVIKTSIVSSSTDTDAKQVNMFKEEIKASDVIYKDNVDKYKTKNNELNNIVKSNLYNNIFLYVTIVVLIIICLCIIYINNHKASLKTQYSIMVITFLLLYYIIYTNLTINITEDFAAKTLQDTTLTIISSDIQKDLLKLTNFDKEYKESLKKEKNKYDGFAKSSNSKVNNLEVVLNDEFINAIKSKELVKFLILFTTICIVCFIIQTNLEDLTTTSIIFIILFIVILSIYFYNINLMTRTKHDNKYWNHRMTMK